MNAALLTPSKFIKAAEFSGRDVTLTIKSIVIEELEKDNKTKERKGIVYFEKTPKGWVLNATNVKCLIALWGQETDAWVGKRVTLYPEANDMSETGVAIRVRGSPDLQRDVTFTLKLAKKKPRNVTLKVTGSKAGTPGTAAAPPPPEDAHDPDTGEVPREPGDDSEELLGADGKPL